MTDVTYTTGDTAPPLSGTVAANLAGAALEAHIRWPGGTVLTRAATATDAPGGAWTVTWQPGDLALPGRAQVELQVTYSSGEIQTFGPATVVVREQLA